MADPVSIIASVGWLLMWILIYTGEINVDGLIDLLGTPPSCVPVIENFEMLYNHEPCGFDHI